MNAMRGEIRTVLKAAGRRQVRGLVMPPGVPLREARRGPHDGTRGAALRGTDGHPPAVLLFDGGRYAYQLDEVRQGGQGRKRVDVAVYRYAPALSPAHEEAMREVAEAYAEHAAAAVAGG